MCLENRDGAVDLHLRAICKRLPQWRHRIAPNHARDLRALIFQCEILVSAGMFFVIRNFALHPDRVEFCFERAANAAS